MSVLDFFRPLIGIRSRLGYIFPILDQSALLLLPLVVTDTTPEE